jgi:hypothetical protein
LVEKRLSGRAENFQDSGSFYEKLEENGGPPHSASGLADRFGTPAARLIFYFGRRRR